MTGRIELTPVPPQRALDFFRERGYAPPSDRFSYLDVFRGEHARAFTVAKAMRGDVLTAIREALDEALAEGLTMERFIADLQPTLERLGWWGEGMEVDPKSGLLETVQLGSRRRLKVIFDANVRAAHAAGRWARIQQTKAAFPFLQYQQVQRPSKRDEHARYHLLILPVDHPAWAKIAPPNGWFCACFLRQLSQRQMDREGLRVSSDFEVETFPFTNHRTGETVDVPLGVDPSWSSNPGIERFSPAAG